MNNHISIKKFKSELKKEEGGRKLVIENWETGKLVMLFRLILDDIIAHADQDSGHYLWEKYQLIKSLENQVVSIDTSNIV